MRWLLVFAFVTGTTGWVPNPPPGDGPRPLEVRIQPTTASAPATIYVTALVERDPENTVLTLSAECSEYMRRSSIQLEGASAPRKHTMLFRPLPAGTCEFRAALLRRDGTVIEDVVTALVKR